MAVSIQSVDSVSITVQASGGPGNIRDFIAIYRATATNQDYMIWKYLANDRTTPRPLVGVTNGLVHLTLPTPVGQYEIRFIAVDSNGNFTVVSKSALFDFDLAPAPVLPTPTSLSLTPTSASLPDNSPIDTRLSTVAVTMSDGSTFAGTLSTNNSATKIVGSALQLARNLTSADDGSANIIVSASQNGVITSATFALTVTPVAVAPTPKTVTLTPSSVSLVDNTTANTQLCTIAVTMSDGSTFSGTLTPNNTIAKIVGSALQLNRNLTSADDGLINISVSARQNNVTASATFALTVTAVAQTGGLKAQWALTQASVSGTTVADASGNNNTATVVGGPLTFGSMGANLNGNQYLDSPLSMVGNALTVSLWFNPASLTNGNSRLIANSHTDVDGKGFQLMINNGGGSGYFDVGDGGEIRAEWGKQLVIGTWYYYVGVYNGSAARAYINGALVQTSPSGGGAIVASAHINVGRNPVYAGDYFRGAVSDVRLYDKALSAAEVLTLFQATTPPPPLPAAPTGITLTPSSPSLLDNSPAGTRICSVSVTMSDGSAFTGTLTTSDTNLFAISGSNVVTKRALTAADDGPHSTTITATQ